MDTESEDAECLLFYKQGRGMPAAHERPPPPQRLVRRPAHVAAWYLVYICFVWRSSQMHTCPSLLRDSCWYRAQDQSIPSARRRASDYQVLDLLRLPAYLPFFVIDQSLMLLLSSVPRGSVVESAWYGAYRCPWDTDKGCMVTEICAEAVEQGKEIEVNNSVLTDPCPGEQKEIYLTVIIPLSMDCAEEAMEPRTKCFVNIVSETELKEGLRLPLCELPSSDHTLVYLRGAPASNLGQRPPVLHSSSTGDGRRLQVAKLVCATTLLAFRRWKIIKLHIAFFQLCRP
jgi:hypothetical protein